MLWLCAVLFPAWAFAGTAAGNAVPEKMRTKADEKPKLAVTDVASQGADASEAAAVTDAIVSAVSDRGLFQVITSKDIQAVVEASRTRQLLGSCTGDANDAPECMGNLGELVGAPFVLTGSLSKIGTAYQLNLQTLDTVKGKLVGRSARLSGDLQTLIAVIPYAAAEATGTPLPPPRSRVLQYTMMAGGAGLVIGGGFVGLQAISRASVVNEELCPGGLASDGSCNGAALKSMTEYQAENQRLGTQRTVSLVMLGAGAALIGAGIFLLPPPEQGGAPRMALVPSGNGAALVGVWP